MKANKSWIYYLFLLLPIFEPQIFTQYSITSMIYIVLNLSETIWLLLPKKMRLSKLIILWIIYRAFLFSVMLINSNMSGILDFGYLTVLVLNILLVFDLAYRKNDMKKLIKAISVLGLIYLIINFITLLIFERGIIPSNFWSNTDGDFFFLGIKTKIPTIVIPTIATSGVRYIIDKSKQSRNNIILVIIFSLANVLYKKVSAGIVFLVLLALILLFKKVFKIVLSKKVCFWGGISIQFCIVFFRIHNLLEFFIENILQKDASLSARTYIWNNAILLLENESIFNLVIGNGIYRNYSFVPFNSSYWQPHSQLLELLYCEGIVGTIIFFSFLLIMMYKFKRISNAQQLLLIICTLVLIISSIELYFSTVTCYVPFLLMYYIGLNQKGVAHNE